MAEELARLWGNLSLSAVESTDAVLLEEEVVELSAKGKSCVVGKLMSDHVVGKDQIRSKMIRSWKTTGMVSFKVVGKNLFLIEFEVLWDKERVLEGRPWTFEFQLFSIVDFDGLTPPQQLEFNEESFWIRMYNLPLACMGKEMGVRLGSSAGVVEEVDTNEDGVGWGEFLRVRVRLNIYKPLVRGRMLKIRNKTELIPFRYEKIPKFCYQCGVISHGDIGCQKKDSRRHQGGGVGLQFGPWLRTPSPNRWSERGSGSGGAAENKGQGGGRSEWGFSGDHQARSGGSWRNGPDCNGLFNESLNHPINGSFNEALSSQRRKGKSNIPNVSVGIHNGGDMGADWEGDRLSGNQGNSKQGISDCNGQFNESSNHPSNGSFNEALNSPRRKGNTNIPNVFAEIYYGGDMGADMVTEGENLEGCGKKGVVINAGSKINEVFQTKAIKGNIPATRGKSRINEQEINKDVVVGSMLGVNGTGAERLATDLRGSHVTYVKPKGTWKKRARAAPRDGETSRGVVSSLGPRKADSQGDIDGVSRLNKIWRRKEEDTIGGSKAAADSQPRRGQ
jgi:hypothetical protein